MHEFMKSRRNNRGLVAPVVIIFLFCLISSGTAESVTVPNNIHDAVELWKTNKCVYPDSSLYASPDEDGSSTSDAVLGLELCRYVEGKTNRTEEEIFANSLCQAVYFVTTTFCSQPLVASSSLTKLVLDKALNYSVMDVCGYAKMFKTDNRTAELFHAALRFDMDVHCVNYCQQQGTLKLSPVCQLLISGLYQFFTLNKNFTFTATSTRGQVTANPKQDSGNTTEQGDSTTQSIKHGSDDGQPPIPKDLNDKVTTGIKHIQSTPADAHVEKDQPPLTDRSSESSHINTLEKETSPFVNHPHVTVRPSLSPSSEGKQGKAVTPGQNQEQSTKKVSIEAPGPTKKVSIETPGPTETVSVQQKEVPGSTEKVSVQQEQVPGSTKSVIDIKPTDDNTGIETYHDVRTGDKGTMENTGKKPVEFQTVDENVPSSGHFFAYFLTAVVICISGYVIFHNKQKILAFIVEGRTADGGRRRNGGSVQYKPLTSNVEEVMPSLDKATSAKNFVY